MAPRGKTVHHGCSHVSRIAEAVCEQGVTPYPGGVPESFTIPRSTTPLTVRGRVRFTRAAGRRRSGATSPPRWRWGEVSHLGSLGQPAHVNRTVPLPNADADVENTTALAHWASQTRKSNAANETGRSFGSLSGSITSAPLLCNRTAPIEPSIVGSITGDSFPLTYEAVHTQLHVSENIPLPEIRTAFLGAQEHLTSCNKY